MLAYKGLIATCTIQEKETKNYEHARVEIQNRSDNPFGVAVAWVGYATLAFPKGNKKKEQ